MKIQRIDHVGVIVNDLAAAKAFFLDLGLEVLGEWEAEGERIDRVIGLDNVKTAAVMLRVPGGQATIELVQFLPQQMKEVFSNFLRTPWVSDISHSPSRISKLSLPG